MLQGWNFNVEITDLKRRQPHFFTPLRNAPGYDASCLEAGINFNYQTQRLTFSEYNDNVSPLIQKMAARGRLDSYPKRAQRPAGKG